MGGQFLNAPVILFVQQNKCNLLITKYTCRGVGLLGPGEPEEGEGDEGGV